MKTWAEPTAMSVAAGTPAPDRLEPLVLAEGARVCGVDETTLDAAMTLALRPDDLTGRCQDGDGTRHRAGLLAFLEAHLRSRSKAPMVFTEVALDGYEALG